MTQTTNTGDPNGVSVCEDADDHDGGHQRALQALLDLQRAQLEALRSDAQERLDELADAFKVMGAALKASGGAEGEVKLSSDVIVQTLQFADNQAQRLEHLIRAMDQMGSLVASPSAESTDAWAALRSGMRSDYTMVRECEVFDSLFGSPPDALAAPPPSSSGESSIELF
ncbi:MAG: hypothetical protein AAF184_11215 [Pseudomonadota bacterium]